MPFVGDKGGKGRVVIRSEAEGVSVGELVAFLGALEDVVCEEGVLVSLVGVGDGGEVAGEGCVCGMVGHDMLLVGCRCHLVESVLVQVHMRSRRSLGWIR